MAGLRDAYGKQRGRVMGWGKCRSRTGFRGFRAPCRGPFPRRNDPFGSRCRPRERPAGEPPAATRFYTADPNDGVGWFDAGQWAFDFDGVAAYTTPFDQRERGAHDAERGVHSRDRRLDRRPQ